MTRVKRDQRLQVMLSAKELEEIDDWRFKNRIPTRAAAVREIMRLGLQQAARQSRNSDIKKP
ncbi:hypothetical protein ASE61_25715 [Bosea sp. Root670]|nr:hypothetical protein ASE61_25715 [Bosea sp. Root670]